jgi:hypothetical protein
VRGEQCDEDVLGLEFGMIDVTTGLGIRAGARSTRADEPPVAAAVVRGNRSCAAIRDMLLRVRQAEAWNLEQS